MAYDSYMHDSAVALQDAVVGQRIVSVERGSWTISDRFWPQDGLKLTLSNGKVVYVAQTSDCCAYTDVDNFLLRADSIDHVITGVVTNEDYTKWHIVAGMSDVLELDVDWSEGSGYYMYGFSITVQEA